MINVHKCQPAECCQPGLSFQWPAVKQRIWRHKVTTKLKFKIYINFPCWFSIFRASFTTKGKVKISMKKIWTKICANSVVYKAKSFCLQGKETVFRLKKCKGADLSCMKLQFSLSKKNFQILTISYTLQPNTIIIFLTNWMYHETVLSKSVPG